MDVKRKTVKLSNSNTNVIQTLAITMSSSERGKDKLGREVWGKGGEIESVKEKGDE